MQRRVTIMLDKELDKKLRLLQAKFITKKADSVSFSEVVNEVIRKGLKTT